MNRKEFEKSKKGILEDLNNNKNLLVSFGGIKQGIGMPVFEFFNSIADIPCDKIFIRDFEQAWYQIGVDAEIDHINKIISYLDDVITKQDYKSVCFLGNSMGGYASILFGSILNVDTVISFAPQTFINRYHRFINRDSRWKKQINRLYEYEDKRKEFFNLKQFLKRNNSYNTQINIYYSTKDVLDKKHAERLRNNRGIHLNPIENGGHAVVKMIRDNGELYSLINAAFK